MATSLIAASDQAIGAVLVEVDQLGGPERPIALVVDFGAVNHAVVRGERTIALAFQHIQGILVAVAVHVGNKDVDLAVAVNIGGTGAMGVSGNGNDGVLVSVRTGVAQEDALHLTRERRRIEAGARHIDIREAVAVEISDQ
nr:hypothetical protein [Ralstonia solanacearum]